MTSGAGVRRSLEDRIILCADCDATRTLSVSISGNLVCSACGSENWMHLPVTANVKESVSFKGELTVDEDLSIEGFVEGSIELKDHNLWIGPHGKVKAKIHAKSVIVAGEVLGDIDAGELVEIKLSGSVRGNISCPRISIIDGAKFQGMINTEIRAESTGKPDSATTRIFRLSHSAP